MATTSPLLRVPLPQASDTDQVPADMLTQTAFAESFWIGRFASSSERTTYLTAAGLGTGIRGMLSWVDAPGRYESFNGTAWVPLVTMAFNPDVSALAGTNWDGVSPLITYKRRVAVTVGASSIFNLTYPTLPNGLLYASITPHSNTGLLGFVVPVPAGHTLSNLQGGAFSQSAVGLASTTGIIVNYDVIGW